MIGHHLCICFRLVYGIWNLISIFFFLLNYFGATLSFTKSETTNPDLPPMTCSLAPIYYTIRKGGKHTSARGLILLHHSSLPFLNFISALALTSSIVGYIISLPLIAIIAAVSFVYVFLPFADCAFGVACFSRNCIHLSDNRAARVRSKGDGTPPWSV
jgi:hypothetical protein